MTKNNTRPYHHGNLKQGLMQAAVDLAESAGNLDFSMRDLAKSAGVSHVAVFHHFKTKEEVLAAVAQEGFHLLLAGLDGSERDAGNDPISKLRGKSLAYIQVARKHPIHFQLMFNGSLADRGRYPELASAARSALTSLQQSVAEAKGQDAFPGLNETDATLMCWAFVHGLAHLVRERQLGGSFGIPAAKQEEHVQKLCQAFFNPWASLAPPQKKKEKRK